MSIKEEILKHAKIRIKEEQKITICKMCEGRGEYSKEISWDYHKRESDYKIVPCEKCQSHGMIKTTEYIPYIDIPSYVNKIEVVPFSPLKKDV